MSDLPLSVQQTSGNGGNTGLSGQEAVRLQLDRILSHSLFANSERAGRFLRFVVEETLAGRGKQLKEYHLGLAVFDRPSSFDPRADPIVRVEAGRLREKLTKYYETDGATDPIIISIPKGGYVASFGGPRTAGRRFVSRFWPSRRLDPKRAQLLLVSWLAVILGAVAALLLIRLYQTEERIRQINSSMLDCGPLWSEFLASPGETVVVFGSPIFFSSEPDKLFLRVYSINDPENWQNHPDYKELQKRFGLITGPRYDYVEMGEAIALQKLTAFFGSAGRVIDAAPAHMVNWDAIKDRNIIFLGPTRFNPLMRRLPEPLDFELGPDFAFHNLRPLPGEQAVYSTPSHRDEYSFAVIASLPGLVAGRRIMVLTSHSTGGTVAAVEYVTRRESCRELVGRVELLKHPVRSYQVLLEVLTQKDQPVKSKYVTHHSTRLLP